MTTETLPITALIATVRGWPTCREAVSRIAPQVAAAGGEFIVADGSGEPAPTDQDLADLPGGQAIRWVSMPHSSVFQLRFAGYRAARGEIVAVTEDHVYVEPDWVERILAAHREFPGAGAIGGAVLNHTDEKLVDWAAFFLTQGPFMPPLQNGVTGRISGPANVSYKKRVLDRLGGDEEHGVIDFLELPDALQGEDLVADDSIRVRHNQSQGLLGTSLAEFDNGRSIAGYRRRQMTRGDWLRILSSPVLPAYRAVRQMRIVRAKDMQPGMDTDRMIKVLPAHVWFQYCAMAGELLGYAAGPGDSPKRLF
jgi:hypothetical protein